MTRFLWLPLYKLPYRVAIRADFKGSSPCSGAPGYRGVFAPSMASGRAVLGLYRTRQESVPVFFAMLLVTANTMAQSVRERTPEFAVLKTLGFSDTAVLGLVLAESLLLAVVGGAAGLGLALAVTRGLHATLSQFLPNFRLTGAACAAGVLYMLLLGLLAGAWPAWSAMRLRIVEALRRG